MRQLEVIGEATKNMPKGYTDAHPSLPWSHMARLRDRLIHGYFNINIEIVWNTVHEDIYPMLPDLQKLLES